MIKITKKIRLDEREIKEEFIHSSGPGGQNVNKVATGVQLRFNVANSHSLPEDVREHITSFAGNRISSEGILVIKATRFRTQTQNRRDAISRLVEIIRKSVEKPRRRLKTRPTMASRERRLGLKRRRSEIKKLRSYIEGTDE